MSDSNQPGGRPFQVVGKPRRRVDGRAKVTGQTRFADDLNLPRMLHCKLLRSPVPHARIRGLAADPPPGHSMDLLIHVEIPPSDIMLLDAWEYNDVAWVPLDQLTDFAKAEPCIPPLVAVAESGLFA